MTNKPVTEALKQILADTYALLVKTQNYHWNVEGSGFRELHLLFEEQYNELFPVADLLAERIRALGEKVPATLADFKSLTRIKEGNAAFDEFAMVKDLCQSNQQMSQLLKKALNIADKADDDSTVDILTQRITAHDKAAWMLKSSLPKEARLKLAI